MRHATPDDTEQLHPVATDQPGLVLHRPLRKLRQIAVVYALLPLVCAAVGAWIATQIAYDRAERHTDGRIAALERDLADRRAANQASNADRDRQLAELRRLICVFADHSTPRDDQVEEVRTRYGCTGGPYPVPSWSPSPPGPGFSRTTGALLPPPARTTSARVPRPSPAGPPPSPTTPPPGPLVCADLPLLPRVCL